MDDLQLLIDLHKAEYRQGPGSDKDTEKAIRLAGLDGSKPLTIADIGCGTGASSLVLARELDAHITAVDFLQPFLDELMVRAHQAEVTQQITPVCCSMDDLPFEDESLDVIWSEGAIYNMGFQHGVERWKRYLKPGGVLVASEITWLSESIPTEIKDYWDNAYPEIDQASSKMKVLEESGYSPLGYFVLSEGCWLENYYRPLQAAFDNFLDRHKNSEGARQIVALEKEEIALYEKYKSYYSYGVYIAKKEK